MGPTARTMIALVLNEGHAIHHVHDRGYVESPAQIPAALATTSTSTTGESSHRPLKTCSLLLPFLVLCNSLLVGFDTVLRPACPERVAGSPVEGLKASPATGSGLTLSGGLPNPKSKPKGRIVH